METESAQAKRYKVLDPASKHACSLVEIYKHGWHADEKWHLLADACGKGPYNMSSKAQMGTPAVNDSDSTMKVPR